MRYFTKIATNKPKLIKELAGLIFKNKRDSVQLTKDLMHPTPGFDIQGFISGPKFQSLSKKITDRSARMDWMKKNHLNIDDVQLAHNMSKFQVPNVQPFRMGLFDHNPMTPFVYQGVSNPNNHRFISSAVNTYTLPVKKRPII